MRYKLRGDRLLLVGKILFGLAAFTWFAGVGNAGEKRVTVEEVYPGVAQGILRNAVLVDLEEGFVLETDGIRISEPDLLKVLKGIRPGLRGQYRNNLFFVLEQEAVHQLLIREARRSGYQVTSQEDKEIMKFLADKTSGITVEEEELRNFYKQNKAAMGGVSFEAVKQGLQHYLLQQKRQKAMFDYIRSLGEAEEIRLDRTWSGKQIALAMDNPVDRARRSGRPTMVEFGATGCRPCDMMQPILSQLRTKYKERLNVVFVHVREKQVLGARFGIRTIPVQVFFDRAGREVFRHVGFYPLKQIEKRMLAMGLTNEK